MDILSASTLVLSGGAFDGITLLGSIHYILQLRSGKAFQSYYGTSVGSMISLLLSIGYTPLELVYSFLSFQQHPLVPDFSFNKDEIKCFDFAPILMHLSEMVSAKTGYTSLTFQDVVRIFQVRLHCVAYNYSQNRMQVFSPKTHPNMCVLEAVKLSCAIPYIFGKCVFQEDVYFDGGIIDNFPVAIARRHKEKHLIGVVLTHHSPHSAADAVWTQLLNLLFTPIYHRTLMTIRKYQRRYPVFQIPLLSSLSQCRMDKEDVWRAFLWGIVCAMICAKMKGK